MNTLSQYPRDWGLPNASPFCVKLECWLRFAGLKYEVREISDPSKAPKGKLPFILEDERELADSRLIIDDLAARHDIHLDAILSPAERAIAHAFGVMLDEHYYWAIMYDRWMGDNWPRTREAFFHNLPPGVKGIVAGMVHKGMRHQLIGQGMGRHKPQEVFELANHDMRSVVDYLGDKPFLMGASPTVVDCSLYGVLCNVLHAPLESPLKDYARRCPSLVAYVERIDHHWFADLFGAAAAS